MLQPHDDDNDKNNSRAVSSKEEEATQIPQQRVRAGFVIGVLAATVILMNLFFVGVAFYIGVDVIPEEELHQQPPQPVPASQRETSAKTPSKASPSPRLP